MNELFQLNQLIKSLNFGSLLISHINFTNFKIALKYNIKTTVYLLLLVQ